VPTSVDRGGPAPHPRGAEAGPVPAAARGIGIRPGGVILLRPDGQPLLDWARPGLASPGGIPAHFRRS
jgi:hypothetical protein